MVSQPLTLGILIGKNQTSENKSKVITLVLKVHVHCNVVTSSRMQVIIKDCSKNSRDGEKRESPEAMEEDDAGEVAEIKPGHFEESMKFSMIMMT